MWFTDPHAAPNRVVVYEVDNKFRVYVTSERGSAEGIRYFDDESEALEKYVRLPRMHQRFARDRPGACRRHCRRHRAEFFLIGAACERHRSAETRYPLCCRSAPFREDDRSSSRLLNSFESGTDGKDPGMILRP